MKHTETVAPVVAAIGALATLACCLPMGFAGAAALAGVGAVAAPLRGWFLSGAIALLAIGIVQVNRQARTCAARGQTAWPSIAILIVAAVVVATVWIAPQLVAGLLADWLPQ